MSSSMRNRATEFLTRLAFSVGPLDRWRSHHASDLAASEALGTEVKWHPKTEWDKMVVILVILSVQFGFVYGFNRE